MSKKYAQCGFVYVATGNKYVEEAIYSANTLKKQHPDIPISLFSDAIPDVPFSHLFEHIFIITNPRYDYADKIEMINSPYERTIFIDTDTICVDPIYELFDLLLNCDMVVHQNAEGYEYEYWNYNLNMAMPEFNTGLIGFVKSALIQKRFFEEWTRLYDQYKYLKLTDQFSFRLLMYHTSIRYCWIPNAYNFMIYFPNYTSLKAKIIHGRPFSHLEEIALKINDVSKLKHSWHRAYFPELNSVVYDYLNLRDSFSLFKIFGVLILKNIFRRLKSIF